MQQLTPNLWFNSSELFTYHSGIFVSEGIAAVIDPGLKQTEIDALASEFKDRFGELPDMTANLFYQMRVKLRAEKAGLSSINWESGQIVLRYPTPTNGTEPKRLADLGAGIRGGKSAYWCSFGEEWEGKLLDVLGRLV